MRSRWRKRFSFGEIAAFLLVPVLLLTPASAAVSKEPPEWTWYDSSLQRRTLQDLQQIFDNHRQWRESGGRIGQRGDLSGAVLRGVDLRPESLNGMGLRVSPDGLLLRRADLTQANLSRASFKNTDLTDTELSLADLTGAWLIDTEMTGARLTNANVLGTFFEPRSLPEIGRTTWALNLEHVTYGTNAGPLAELRQAFRFGGYRLAERKVTYALKQHEAWDMRFECTHKKQILDCFEYGFNRTVLDGMSRYGLAPWRPLQLAGLLWAVCSVFYALFICCGRRASLYRIDYGYVDGNRTPIRETIISPPQILGRGRWQRYLSWLKGWGSVLWNAMFFSLMSTFNIGFRDVHLGRWMRLLTRTDFELRSAGWARSLSGWQALISLVLIALWAVTYWGRPFE